MIHSYNLPLAPSKTRFLSPNILREGTGNQSTQVTVGILAARASSNQFISYGNTSEEDYYSSLSGKKKSKNKKNYATDKN